jgi:hypothetical protein
VHARVAEPLGEGLEPAAQALVARGPFEEALQERAQVEPGPPATIASRPRAAISPRAARARRAYAAAENASPGSATSTRWCLTSARSSGVGLALPMSRPR